MDACCVTASSPWYVRRFVDSQAPSGWKPWGGFLLRAGQAPGSRFGDQWLFLTRRLRDLAGRHGHRLG
jgi:hypothetical protein